MRKGLTFIEAIFLSSCIAFMAITIVLYAFQEEQLKVTKKQAEDLQLQRIADSLETLASYTINHQFIFIYELPAINHKVIYPGYPNTDSGMASMTLYNFEYK